MHIAKLEKLLEKIHWTIPLLQTAIKIHSAWYILSYPLNCQQLSIQFSLLNIIQNMFETLSEIFLSSVY